MRCWLQPAMLGILLLLAAGMAARAQTAEIGIELNKAETTEGVCRIYLVVANRTPDGYDGFTVELVSFDGDGVIGQRLAVELAPLRAGRTAVKLFDLPNTGCEAVRRLLINDVTTCTVAGASRGDCFERVRPSTRAGVELFQ